MARAAPRTLYLIFFLTLTSIFTYGIWTHLSSKAYQASRGPTAAEPHALAESILTSPSPTSTLASTTSSAPPLPTPSLTPKITVIAIWIPRHGDLNYLPYFFQSVEANPKIDLLFVNVIDHQNGCKRHSNATNIQELCLNEKEYYDLHVDFLCKDWQCSDAERKGLFEHAFRQRGMDHNYSFFRILRSGIFAKWIDPATTIWGWCDLDTVWGNFERTFPWDLAPNYDVIAITSQPDFGDQRLLFTRGHMAFFRHTPETLRKLHAFPPFKSLLAYLLASPLRDDAEESQFSHYYFAANDAFTFLHVEGMIEGGTVLLSEKGTFYLDLHKEDCSLETRQKLIGLIAAAHAQSTGNETHRFPSFTSTGVQKPSPVKSEGFRTWVWFPDEYIVYYEPGWGPGMREHKAYFMRNVEHGLTEQRWESRDRYMLDRGGLNLNEGLYKHFQGEKHREWFKRFPAKRLPPGHTMVNFHSSLGEIWDEAGNVVFETGIDEQLD